MKLFVIELLCLALIYQALKQLINIIHLIRMELIIGEKAS